MGILFLDQNKSFSGWKCRAFTPVIIIFKACGGGGSWEIMAGETAVNGFKNKHQEWAQPQGTRQVLPGVKKSMDGWASGDCPHHHIMD